jgi:hydroxymethylglutaryl-CoA reductase
MSNNPINLFSHFYSKPLKERQAIIQDIIGLSNEELKELGIFSHLNSEMADKIGENIIGSYDLPFGIATNFIINGNQYIIPMVTEEPSVIAAASNGARMAKIHGGFSADPVQTIMTGQIQVVDIQTQDEYYALCDYIKNNQPDLISLANQCDPKLIDAAGGAIQIDVRKLSTKRGMMAIIELAVNVADAMGANIINTMVETIAENLRGKIPGRILLRIISNAATQRKVRVSATFDKQILGGESVVDDILNAWVFAQSDSSRAVTHNKGIMNGITALAVATGNDTRAIEAAFHGYASTSGRYAPLTIYSKSSTGNLVGVLEAPLPFGIVGGLTSFHPMVKIALKILGVKSSSELSQVAGALGLAQNLAALRALVTEGIQRGHMRLHSRKK